MSVTRQRYQLLEARVRTVMPAKSLLRARRSTSDPRETHPGYEVTKRAVDIVGSLLLLVVLAPLLLLVAVAVKLTSRGPVLYVHERRGQHGKPIRVLKFRTMMDGADQQVPTVVAVATERSLHRVDAPTFKSRQDPRVTAVGRLLRRTSLDETPQLWNVLTGDMSLVGPRPLVTSEVETLSAEERMRELVKPGITCIWQVSGRSDVPFRERMAMDVEYVRRRSLRLDLWLMLRTPLAVLSGRGAY